MKKNMETAILLMQCPDQKGIVAKVSGFLFSHDVNIIQADQYSTDPENGIFFLRIEFCFDITKLGKENLKKGISVLADDLKADCQIHYKSIVMNMGILVSKEDHCLFDILYRWKSGEINVNIPFVIGNHDQLEPLVRQFGIDFYHIPVTKENKAEKEHEMLSHLRRDVDFIVLARYMQILSADFLCHFLRPVINIHHSFLPSFKGANPYLQAYDHGVKIIGATSHYVTEELDEGPIIEQIVERVSHRDDVETLKRKGKNLEKAALSNAIHAHIEHRIIRFQNKTIVFD